MKRILTLTIILLFLCSPAWAADYTILNATTTFDGDTDCAGTCTAADTIIIEGGARGDLCLKDINGAGSYITIINEDSTRVVMTESGDTYGVLRIENCDYIDLRGDGLAAHSWAAKSTAAVAYGIQITGTQSQACMVNVQGDNDHIKISYIEIDLTGATNHSTSGLQVQSSSLSNTVTLFDYEIHHNYVHGDNYGYAGFYLGNNQPGTNNDPYIANFLVHHNLFEDMGSYGMTLKGFGSTNTQSKVYNNFVLPSNRASGNSTGLDNNWSANASHGLHIGWLYDQEVNVYNNWCEKTGAAGIRISSCDALNVNVYNNVILGCGQANDATYSHGILFYDQWVYWYDDDGPFFYNNTIVEPVRYGIYYSSNIGGQLDSGGWRDNLIVEPTVGYSSSDDADFAEGTGANADTEVALASNAGFTAWSDDSDYSNDDFALQSGASAVGACGTGYPLFDYAGTERPQGSDADDGAYEYLVPGDDPPGGNNDFSQDTNCFALYNFESGALVTDSKGSNTLTLGAAADEDTTDYKQGLCSGDFEYANSDHYIVTDANLDTNFPLKTGDTQKIISISAWIKPESDINMTIASKWNAQTPARSFAYRIETVGGDPRAEILLGFNGGASEEKYFHGSTLTVDGTTWYHVTATYAGDTTKAYAIRIRDASFAVVGTDLTGTATLDASGLYVGGADFMVGGLINAAGVVVNQFDGNIDELLTFDKALTADDETNIAKGEYGTPAPYVTGMSAKSANLTAAGILEFAIGFNEETFTEGEAWTIEATFDYPVAAQTMSYVGKWNDQIGWTQVDATDVWWKTTYIEPTSVKADTNVLTEDPGAATGTAVDKWDWVDWSGTTPPKLYVNVGSDPVDDVITPSPWETYVVVDTLAGWRQNSFGDAQIGADITLPTGVTITDAQAEDVVVAGALTGLGTYPGNTVANPSTSASPITFGTTGDLAKISDLVGQVNTDVYMYLTPITDNVTITANGVTISGIGRTQVNTGTWIFSGNNCHLRCVRVTSTVTGAGANGNTYHPICSRGVSRMGMNL